MLCLQSSASILLASLISPIVNELRMLQHCRHKRMKPCGVSESFEVSKSEEYTLRAQEDSQDEERNLVYEPRFPHIRFK